jgi:16S rRNA U516 pseudouridylate synthase RsuA-like enzyme
MNDPSQSDKPLSPAPDDPARGQYGRARLGEYRSRPGVSQRCLQNRRNRPPISGRPRTGSGDARGRGTDPIPGRGLGPVRRRRSPTRWSVPKRVLAPRPRRPSCTRYWPSPGMGSRLEMEQLIMEGRITVNNEPAHIGQRIQFGDHVKVNGKPIRFRSTRHRRVSSPTTSPRARSSPTTTRKTVRPCSALPKLLQGKWQSVGRLDLNTEGLLLFTSSGELANNLMHPRFGLEREYAVRVLGALSNDEKQRLLDGVGSKMARPSSAPSKTGAARAPTVGTASPSRKAAIAKCAACFEALGHAVSRLDPHPLRRHGVAARPQARRLDGTRRPRHPSR